MAIIAISRQVASFGDEISMSLVDKTGYTFFDRHMIEEKIVALGFPREKLKKYDERKPGFFASLAKDRDEYLNYLQLALLETASQDDCILIGRGAYLILQELPNLVSVRLVAPYETRKNRLMEEFGWNEKQALARLDESDVNRAGFHKSFFNADINDADRYQLVLNTGMIGLDNASSIIADMSKVIITEERDKDGKKRLYEMLIAQRLVNKLIFEYKLNINFLHAVLKDGVLTLQGVADSASLAEKAVFLASEQMPDVEVFSAISVIQDFKAYP